MYARNEKVIPVYIEEEMKDSYINYAMSVIVGRALPDVRDGLKPVHRRILFSMKELGSEHNKPFKKSARIVGECFIKDTLVATKKGLILIQDVERGDLVYTQRGERKVSALFEMPPRELLKIRLENGTSNTVTPSQKIKVLTDELHYVWKEAKDLTADDYVVTKNIYPELRNKTSIGRFLDRHIYLNENISYALGVFLSDGWIEERSGRLCFYSNDKEIIRRLCQIFKEEFGYEAKIETKPYLYKSESKVIKNTGYQIRIHKRNINDFLTNAFCLKGMRAPTKNVPKQLFSSPSSVIWSFVSGLIDGDGSIHTNRNVVHYGSVSEKLIDQLQILLQHQNVLGFRYSESPRAERVVNGRRVIGGHKFYSLEFRGSYAHLLVSCLSVASPGKSSNIMKMLTKEQRDCWSSLDMIPYAGRVVFEELSKTHLGGGWYRGKDGEKFRAGIKYQSGAKIRYSTDLKNKPLKVSQIVSWGIMDKLRKIESPTFGFIDEVINERLSFVKVDSVECAPAEKTYDIQVENDHEFIANGMLSHNCMGKYHPHGDVAIYDTIVRMAQDFSLRYPLVEGQGNFGCFTIDTKIKLTDGRSLSFGELIEEDAKGKNNYTFTFNNKTGKVEVSQIYRPRLTKKNASIMKITLDNNEEIKCTLNHKFMLRDGTYKDAQELVPGSSLMPLYARLSSRTDDPNAVGYEMIRQPLFDKWSWAHRLADEWNIKNKVYQKSAGRIRHHVDCNKLNNNPDNILRIQWREHWKTHYSLTSSRHKNDLSYREKLSEGRKRFWDDVNNREAYSYRMTLRNKKMWRDPEYRKKKVAAVKKLWGDTEYKKMMAEASKDNLKRLWQRQNFRALLSRLKSEELRKKWQNKDYSQRTAGITKKMSLSLWANPEHRSHISAINKRRWLAPEYREKFMPILRQNGVNAHFYRFLKVCERASENQGGITPGNYEKARCQYGSRQGAGIVRYEKAVKKYCGGDASRIAEFLYRREHKQPVLNHKVLKVEFLEKRENVYDLTINTTHNFALAAGVFVHNSVDGDAAASMRYTEARLSRITEWMLMDLEKNTVDFMPNFDGSLKEPMVLPACLPNLLVNGSSGIAVGMATNIPPHNLKEIAEAVAFVIDSPDCEIKDLLKKVKGPDFPTGGIIRGTEGIKNAYTTGRGLLRVHAKAFIEEQKNGKEAIIIKELPYQVNKANLIVAMAGLIQDKKIEGITDLRDESDRDGMRVVIEVRRGANSKVILNQLYKHTQMQTTFGVIMLALIDGRPRVLNLKQILEEFIRHRKEIITRRTKYDLEKALDRAHILEGLKIALKELDRVIKIIRASKDPQEAKAGLMEKIGLSDRQAQAILEMQLQRLTHLERDKIDKEYLELIKKIELFKSILESEKKVLEIIKEDMKELSEKFGDERRTDILPETEELDIEDLIAEEDVVITVSHTGYIKRLAVSGYRKQRRGGKGVTGADMKEEDFIEHLFVASTHDYMLFFTDKGIVHWLKVHEIPEAGRTSKGRPIVNLLTLGTGEKVSAFVPVRQFKEGEFLVMATKNGTIKKTALTAYSNPRKGGIIGITLEKDDELIEVQRADGDAELLLSTREGKAIRFKESQVRDMGRGAKGVRGIRLGKKDALIAMEIAKQEQTVLTVTQEGFGKRTSFKEYRLQSRGGKGIINIKVTGKNGEAVGMKTVSDKDEIMLITEKGMIVRSPIKDIRATGRSTQGVRLMRLDKGDKIACVAKIIPEDETAEEEKIREAKSKADKEALAVKKEETPAVKIEKSKEAPKAEAAEKKETEAKDPPKKKAIKRKK